MQDETQQVYQGDGSSNTKGKTADIDLNPDGKCKTQHHRRTKRGHQAFADQQVNPHNANKNDREQPTFEITKHVLASGNQVVTMLQQQDTETWL